MSFRGSNGKRKCCNLRTRNCFPSGMAPCILTWGPSPCRYQPRPVLAILASSECAELPRCATFARNRTPCEFANPWAAGGGAST
eukprot:4984611-Pyramimonas_sp.AAC.1